MLVQLTAAAIATTAGVATATTVVIAIAVVSIIAITTILARKGVAGNVSRLSKRPQSIDQISVLLSLASLQTQSLILLLEVLHTSIDHEVQNLASVAILVVNNVTSVISSISVNSTSIGCHLVLNIGKRRTIIAAILLPHRLFILCFL